MSVRPHAIYVKAPTSLSLHHSSRNTVQPAVIGFDSGVSSSQAQLLPTCTITSTTALGLSISTAYYRRNDVLRIQKGFYWDNTFVPPEVLPLVETYRTEYQRGRPRGGCQHRIRYQLLVARVGEDAIEEAREAGTWDKFVCSIERHPNRSVLLEDEGREALMTEWNNRELL